jgi:peptidoglycan/LPS O-acetylase OafA/YrhL
MQEQRLASLDSLRGIGAVMVMLYHTTYAAFGGANGLGIALMLRRGYLAVDMFFILSGFVLAHVYGNEFGNSLAPNRLGAFIWARLARIYPVHLVAIVLMLRLFGQAESVSGHALVMNVLLLQGPWLQHASWNEPAWSISAEWHAYLLFPFLCAVLWRLPAKAAVVVGVACVSALVLLYEANQWYLQQVTAGPMVLARALPEFISGILVYRMYREEWLRPLWRSDYLFVAIVLAIVVLSAAWPTDIVIILLLPWLILAIATNDGRANSFLNARVLMFLGYISYSLYMVHYVCLTVVFTTFTGLNDSSTMFLKVTSFFGTVALSFLLATLVSRRIEYPVRTILRNLWKLEATLHPARAPSSRI